jgi:hypothetical protein
MQLHAKSSAPELLGHIDISYTVRAVPELQKAWRQAETKLQEQRPGFISPKLNESTETSYIFNSLRSALSLIFSGVSEKKKTIERFDLQGKKGCAASPKSAALLLIQVGSDGRSRSFQRLIDDSSAIDSRTLIPSQYSS